MTAGTIGVVILVARSGVRQLALLPDVDEVEVADNLWGSLIGLYVYALLFPAWWALNLLGQAPEPDDWVIFGASMLSRSRRLLVSQVCLQLTMPIEIQSKTLGVSKC